ncbi:MAG: DUF1801 domain-containing protein [candidate division KSB1 bacterium]|jgi:uncharacterized protein YdhG (YjbR/CyaY superfamily)|nr:DUF1801 domain-containing protein [candidate division KSB1 bacterium]
MNNDATTVKDYLNQLPEERKEPFNRLRKAILDHLPDGFSEMMSYGMIGYVVPHNLYPAGYHVDPDLPLPFINIASQKNFIALYHMGIYAMPDLLEWFRKEYPKHSKTRLDMGKSCIRFKKTSQIPYDLIGQLVEKVSVLDWIENYESNVKKR